MLHDALFPRDDWEEQKERDWRSEGSLERDILVGLIPIIKNINLRATSLVTVPKNLAYIHRPCLVCVSAFARR
jgi:hypothetical protein